MSSRGGRGYRGGSRGGGRNGNYGGGGGGGGPSRSSYDRYGSNGYDNYDSRGSSSRNSYDRYRDNKRPSGYEGSSRDHRTPERKRPRNDYQDSRRSYDYSGGSGGGYHGRNSYEGSSSSFNDSKRESRSNRYRNLPSASTSSSKYRRDSLTRRSRERMGPPAPVPSARSNNVGGSASRRFRGGRPVNLRGGGGPLRSRQRPDVRGGAAATARAKLGRKRYLAATPRSREMLRRLNNMARIKR